MACKCGKWRQMRKGRWPEWKRSCRGPYGWITLLAEKFTTRGMYHYSAYVEEGRRITFNDAFETMAEAKRAADRATRELC